MYDSRAELMSLNGIRWRVREREREREREKKNDPDDALHAKLLSFWKF